MIAIGERVGDYVVECVLGEDVYEAVHVLLPRRARLRVFAAATPASLRESCVLETLRHPAVPRVYECGLLADRRPWLATELVDGVATGDILLTVGEVVAMLRDVADVLAHAHARGIVHGRLSLDAIVHGPRGLYVRSWGDARPGTTGSHDVAALGAVAVHALLGSVPPAGHRRWVGVPTAVAALVERMLLDDPARRPSAADVRDEAARIVACEPVDDVDIEEIELVELADDADEDELTTPKPRWTPPGSYSTARVIARASLGSNVLGRRS